MQLKLKYDVQSINRVKKCLKILRLIKKIYKYSETLNKEYIERIHQMSSSSLSDNGMLQIFSFLVK